MIWSMKKISTFLCALPLTACLIHKPSGDDSQLKQETDDRTSAQSVKLIDVAPQIEDFINHEIIKLRRQINPAGGIWTPENGEQLVEKMNETLAVDAAGTGIVLFDHLGFKLEVSDYTMIEAWIVGRLNPEKREILSIKFKDSLYGDNTLGVFAKFPAHVTEQTADHSIAPVVRIGETLIGIDKIGHFFQQGYWYYDANFRGELTSLTALRQFGEFMEGHPDLDKKLYPVYRKIYGYYCSQCITMGGFGYFGAASTGVISLADMSANQDGFSFFRKLSEHPDTYVFRFADYNVNMWNEQNNKSLFSPGLKVRSP